MRLFGQEIVLGEKIEKLNRVDISKIAISKNGEVIKKEDVGRTDEREAYIKKLVQSDIDQQNKIALLSAKIYKLQKENAELKNKYVKNITDCDICDTYCNSQLIKAKEIIKNLLFFLNQFYSEDWPVCMDEAQQFIKDSEVEK